MDSTEHIRLQRRARRAYEWGRLRRSLGGASPVLVVLAIAAGLSHRPASVLWFGAAATAAAALMLWYGRAPQRAVLPGILAGLVPLVLALGANHLHACSGGCSSLCVPACALGGVAAGVAVARIGARQRAGLAFWLSASALTLYVGAMGCSCVGYSGVLGLGAGYGIGLTPGLLRRAFAS